MDYQDPEITEIPGPTLQPQTNIALLKAQLDMLNAQENDKLIGMMGGTQPQDFQTA